MLVFRIEKKGTQLIYGSVLGVYTVVNHSLGYLECDFFVN